MRGRRGIAPLAICVLAAAQLAPTDRASAQSLDPAEPAFWAASGVVLLTTWQLDDRLRRSAPRSGGDVSNGLASLGYWLGGRPVVVSGLLSAVAISHLTGWPAEENRVLRVAAGAAAAGLASEAVKTMVGRGRPRDVGDPREFSPFSRDNAWLAFPSGHATAAFSVAAALDQEFDLGGFQVLVYGLAAVVAWSRHYDDAHWASDTVAGGIVGVAAARSAVSWLQRQERVGSPHIRLAAMAGAPVIAVTLPVN
jgi:membrane-associated phospholipid phosphatase